MPSRFRTIPGWMPRIIPQPSTLENGVFIWNVNEYPNYRVPQHLAFMRDVVGQQGQNNPVNQLVVDLYSTGFPSFVVNSTGRTRKVIPNDTIFVPALDGYPNFEDWPWVPRLSAATLSDWSIGAFNKFHSQVPAKISLANSLYELKDIKGLIPKIDRKSLTKTASGNFLAFEFGVKPMISDIKAIASLSDDIDKRLKHLISVNKKTTDLRFDREESLTDPHFFFISNNSPAEHRLVGFDGSDHSSQGLVFELKSYSHKLHIGAHLYQDLQGLEDSNAKLKALVAGAGFNRPATVVWNAIPYSFVVDWFFSVGKLIDSLEVQPFGGEYRVSDVMWSCKSEAQWTIWNQYGPGYSLSGRTQIGTARARIYERYNGFPATSIVLTNGVLSPDQQVLALAMLEQRRR